MKPTFSSKLRKETRGYHSSIAVVLFVIFITIAVSLFFLAVKGVFKNNSKKQEETTSQSEADTKEANEAKVEPQIEEETTYTVKSGDSLYGVGIKFGIDWKKIAEANNLEEPYALSTGQELKIPKNSNGK